MVYNFNGFPDDAPRNEIRDWVADCIAKKYRPHEKQKSFHDAVDSGAKYLACNEGRQTGKTLQTAIEVAVELAYRPRGLQRFRSVLNIGPLRDTAKLVFNYVYGWIVQENLFGCAKRLHGSDFMLYLETPWGSRLDCRTTENPKALRGEGVTMVTMDEDAFMPNGIIRTYIKPILAANNGRLIRISTPNGTDNHWFFDWHEYFERMKTDPLYFAMHATSYDNPYLPEGFVDAEKESAERAYADGDENAIREFNREWLAMWTCINSAILGNFMRTKGNEEWHVKSNLEPAEGSYIDVGIDYGYSAKHPTGIVFLQNRTDGVSEIYKEIRTQSPRDEVVCGFINETLQEYSDKYKCKKGRVFGDPSAKGHLDELRYHGLYVYKGDREVNDVVDGLTHLRNLFGRTNKPYIIINSKCEKLIKEIENYQFMDDGKTPMKIRDDLIDAMRYGVFGGSISTMREMVWA